MIEAAEHAAWIARSALANLPSQRVMQTALDLQSAPFREAMQTTLSQTAPVLEAAQASLARQMAPLHEAAIAAANAQFAPIRETVLMAANAQLASIREIVLTAANAQTALTFQTAQISGALRSALPIILASQQWAWFNRNLTTTLAGPLRAYAEQLALASDAGRGQLAAIAIRDLAATAGAVTAHTGTATATRSTTGWETERDKAPVKAARPANVLALAVVLAVHLAVNDCRKH